MMFDLSTFAGRTSRHHSSSHNSSDEKGNSRRRRRRWVMAVVSNWKKPKLLSFPCIALASVTILTIVLLCGASYSMSRINMSDPKIANFNDGRRVTPTTSNKNYNKPRIPVRTHLLSSPTIAHRHIVNCTSASSSEQLQLLFANDDPGTTILVYKKPLNIRRAVSVPPFYMNVHSNNELISRRIRLWGCFECSVLERFLQFLQTITATTTTTTTMPPDAAFVLDIGANLGMYSLYAAALGFEVYSFEPYRKNWQRLCQSIQMNAGFDQQITLFNVALTQKTTTVEFYDEDDSNMGGTHVRAVVALDEDGQQSSNNGMEGVDFAHGIPLTDLQAVLPQNNSRPVILKIDVEGFECNALGGALDYLRTLEILYVQIEWSPERLRACTQREAIFDLFRQNRLTPYQHDPVLNVWKRINAEEWESWQNSWFLRVLFDYHLIDFAWVRE